MFDPHRLRLLKKRLKYHNASGTKSYRVLATPCLCSCFICSKSRELYGNSPNRYTFSDQKKLAKAKYDIENEITG